MNVIPQAVRDGFLKAIGPIARAFIRAGISPNVITTLGALVVFAAAVAFGMGAIRWGGALILASGVLDLLDGQVARGGGKSTPFGAFYDSTLDRAGEAAVFTGIALWFVHGGVPTGRLPLAVAMCMTALTSSLLVSYTRARAEGLGLEAKVGIAQRAERILLLGAPTLFFGPGTGGALLFWIVIILAASTSITVVQRVIHVARLLADPSGRASLRRDTLPGHAAAFRKGH
jgi:CDP-diacylglycerol---glycerol-3-phosphate 3-phosphatidyltransferase